MDNKMQVDAPEAIDESLYSRQIYVLGKEAMEKMAGSTILIAGLDGLGVEIAKNVALAGVKSLTLWDPTPTTVRDLGSQFYLTDSDLGQPRAAACASRLGELNQYVPVSVAHEQNIAEALNKHKFAVCVFTGSNSQSAVFTDRVCRENGTKFIWVAAAGLAGFVFNDFGPGFQVVDNNGEEPVSNVVATIDADGEVFAPESERHNLESGMVVDLKGVEPASINGRYTIKVSGPLSFSIGPLNVKYVRGGQWTQVKQAETVDFEPLENQLANPEQLITDFAKFDRPNQLHVGFLAISAFENKHARKPRPYNQEDLNEIRVLAKNVTVQFPDVLGTTEIDEKLLGTLVFQSSGEVAPMCAILGGMAAQEVLKAVSGKFMPVKQFMYFDAFEALPDPPISESDAQARECRYDGLYAVFGKTFMDHLANLKVFLVGAGAIGCEVLKNWALLGVGTGPNGHLYVTDNDTIERSNLNRQFLFRAKDLGQSKSETAVSAVVAMNPALKDKFTAYCEKVGKESQNVFNDDFYNNLDLVTNALDNIEARTYVDRRCVFYNKPLIESGTLGTKGSVQVVVPKMTESYSSSQDPPEKGIPLCTIRSFPTSIDHTIAWAKTKFEDLFFDACQNVNLYLSQPNFVESTLKQSTSQKETLETIYSYLVDKRPLTFEQCIYWALGLFEEYYRNEIRQLLYNFPEDAVTSSGAPFWAPPKRTPQELAFNRNDKNHFDFLVSAANLRAASYGLHGETDPRVFVEALNSYTPREFTPDSAVKIKASDEEPDVPSGLYADEDEMGKIAAKLPPPSSLAGFRLKVAEFEKDDDTNFHIDFINAASNLRAINYGIDPVDHSKTKFIAGRIIPAIATTTALVTGLSTLEAIKVVEGKELEQFKNGFINLALPFFGFSEPIASTKIKYNNRSIDKVWGRFSIDGDVTLQEFLDFFSNEHGLEVSMIVSDQTLLYASFHPPAKTKERLPMHMSKLVEKISKKPIPKDQHSLTLEICANDEDDEDVDDLPFAVVRIRKNQNGV